MRNQSPENLWGVVIIALSLVLVLSGIASCCTKLLRWRRQRVQEVERERHGARKDNEPLPGRLTTWEQLAPLNKSHRGVLRSLPKSDGSSHAKKPQPLGSSDPPSTTPNLNQHPAPTTTPAPPHLAVPPPSLPDPSALHDQQPPAAAGTQQDGQAADAQDLPPLAAPQLPPTTARPATAPAPSAAAPAGATPQLCPGTHHPPAPRLQPDHSSAAEQPQPQQGPGALPAAGDTPLDRPTTAPPHLLPRHRGNPPSTQQHQQQGGQPVECEVTVAPSEPPAPATAAGAAVSEQDDGLCPICLEDYCCSDMMRVLPCGHFFHQECVDVWMDTQAMVCPLCRTDLRAAASPRKPRPRRRLPCAFCFRGGARQGGADSGGESPAPSRGGSTHGGRAGGQQGTGASAQDRLPV